MLQRALKNLGEKAVTKRQGGDSLGVKPVQSDLRSLPLFLCPVQILEWKLSEGRSGQRPVLLQICPIWVADAGFS